MQILAQTLMSLFDDVDPYATAEEKEKRAHKVAKKYLQYFREIEWNSQ